MKISKKDQSFVLFLLSAIILLWFVIYFFSSILSRSLFNNSDNYRSIAGASSEWFNLSENLKPKDLKNRVILLDFWTYACVNCLHMIPEIKKLEEEFGDKLTVIGVHSGKFDNEKLSQNIKNAVIKYDISHPVVNDANLVTWNHFKVNAWPTLILLNPRGNVVKTYVGEIGSEKLKYDIKKQIKKYKFELNSDPLPITLEKNKIPGHILKFPSKLRFAKDFEYKNIPKIPAIFIANSAQNNILAVSLNGTILLKIGAGQEGFEDGTIASASFREPRGMLFKNNILYVADTKNHALRKVDFSKNQVTTLIGSGNKGPVISGSINADKAELNSPWDLEFFPDNSEIVIANAGTHQILKYNIAKNTLSPFIGNGQEDIIDGKYPNNATAQTSGLSTFAGKLYFVDSESSSLRVSDQNGEVKTLIGSGLFKFGYKNGSKETALMQHPTGVYADDTGIYIADSFNHVIRKYDLISKTLKEFSGTPEKSGASIGAKPSYNEPEAIISVLNKFYIADTNNNRIMVLDRAAETGSSLDVMPPLKMPKEGMLEYLPNLETIPTQKVKNDTELNLTLELDKGWKINESAPSFFNLVEVNDTEANLIANYDWNAIKSGSIKLPKLSTKHKYYLQGTIYYCEDKKNSICLIRSYEQQLQPVKIGGEENLKIKFIYY